MKYKVVYIHANSNIIAGQELALVNRIVGLDKERFYPIVIIPCEGVFADLLRKNDIEVKMMRLSNLHKKNPFPYLFTVLRLAFFFKKAKIVLVHTSGAYPNQYCSIAAKIAGISCICHISTIYPIKALRKSFVKLADKIITVSNAAKNPIHKIGVNSNKVVTIYDGILDPDKINIEVDGNKIRDEFGISSSTQIVAQIGQVIERKGAKYFLEMACIISNSFSDVKFLIVGDDQHQDGAYRRKMEAMTKELGLARKVIFAGFCKDLFEVIASLDVMVLASLREGLPMSIVQAMAQGVPVVATAVSGIPEVIAEGITGFLVPPEDPPALAKAVLRLLQDRQKAKEMGKEAQKLVLKKFTISSHAREVEKIYYSLIT